MPYSNVPKELWPAMERCTSSLKKKGVSGDKLYGICYNQVVGKGVAEAAKKRRKEGKHGRD